MSVSPKHLDGPPLAGCSIASPPPCQKMGRAAGGLQKLTMSFSWSSKPHLVHIKEEKLNMWPVARLKQLAVNKQLCTCIRSGYISLVLISQ